MASMQLQQASRVCARRTEAPAPLRPVPSVVALQAPRHAAVAFSSAAPVPARRSASRVVAAAAAAPEAAKAQQQEATQWYALVASAEFYLNDVQNESLAEQLRERVRFFKEQNREIDFYLVPEPKWLDSKYPAQAKQVRRPCVALISSDKLWITFMKLRLDRVLRIDLGPVSKEEALAVGGEIPKFTPPAKWTAPYSAYTPGWWNVFIPKQ